MFLALLLVGGVKVTLHPEATVRGTEISLAQVATVEGDDAAEVERVRSLKLGYAPAPGYSRTLAAPRVSADVARLACHAASRACRCGLDRGCRASRDGARAEGRRA